MEAPKTVLPGDVNVISYCHCRPVRWREPNTKMGCILVLLQKDKDSIPCTFPDHGHSPTYLFFFSFFIFLLSLRLFCGAFLLSFTPLLFSFITPSFLSLSMSWSFRLIKKGEPTTPVSVSFRYPLYAKWRGISVNLKSRPCISRVLQKCHHCN